MNIAHFPHRLWIDIWFVSTLGFYAHVRASAHIKTGFGSLPHLAVGAAVLNGFMLKEIDNVFSRVAAAFDIPGI